MTALSERDVVERIVRLETKLDFIIAQMDKMPPSPSCLSKHTEIDQRLADIERWRNKAIGALVALNIFFILATEKLRSVLFPT